LLKLPLLPRTAPALPPPLRLLSLRLVALLP
jgi:hypothetical protein